MILTASTTNISQSALFGSVGAALAVGAIAVVGIVFVVVVAVRRRKKNKNGVQKGIWNAKLATFHVMIISCKL